MLFCVKQAPNGTYSRVHVQRSAPARTADVISSGVRIAGSQETFFVNLVEQERAAESHFKAIRLADS